MQPLDPVLRIRRTTFLKKIECGKGCSITTRRVIISNASAPQDDVELSLEINGEFKGAEGRKYRDSVIFYFNPVDAQGLGTAYYRLNEYRTRMEANQFFTYKEFDTSIAASDWLSIGFSIAAEPLQWYAEFTGENTIRVVFNSPSEFNDWLGDVGYSIKA